MWCWWSRIVTGEPFLFVSDHGFPNHEHLNCREFSEGPYSTCLTLHFINNSHQIKRNIHWCSRPQKVGRFRRSHFRRQEPSRPYDARYTSSERRNLWARTLAGNFAYMPISTLHLGIFYMPQICDMGPTALLPLRSKTWWGFFHPEKSWRLRPGLNPRTWVLKGSTLLLDHRSRIKGTLHEDQYAVLIKSRSFLLAIKKRFKVWI
jgi:hypothetical protein